MTENLKPCPFCGGEAKYTAFKRTRLFITIGVGYRVQCVACKTRTISFWDDKKRDLFPQGQAKHECNLIWNTRTALKEQSDTSTTHIVSDKLCVKDSELDDACPRGDGCDLTIAYMLGQSRELERVKLKYDLIPKGKDNE